MNSMCYPALISTLLCLSIIVGCGIGRELRQDRKTFGFRNWEQDFKDRTLCLCQLQGLNNKTLQDSLIKQDKSYYNPLAIAVFDDTINQLLKKEVRQILADSAASPEHYPTDLYGVLMGKQVMKHCLELYRSRRLDSIVSIEKRNWKQIRNIMGRIHEKIPTF